MKTESILRRRLRLIAGVFLIVILAHASAALSAAGFREQFIESYRANNFNYLATLVKSNGTVIPGEVKAIVKEAMAEGKSFEERMALLDIASAMASMHKHWNGDEELIKEVEAVQRAEIKKEEARRKELTKWDEYEKFLGNFVMRADMAGMEKKGVAPVVYPHWLHRLYYDCKACHQDIFKMKRGENGITHEAMRQGKVCGTCHDGKTSFGSEENCVSCHSAGLDGAKRLKDVSKLDLNSVEETAARLGAGWSTENLPPGRLPLDRFGSIDWVYLKAVSAHAPLKSAGKDKAAETRDSTVLFESTMGGISPVPFSHATHSSRLDCSSCHPSLFSEELGANKVNMKAMAEGKFCGYCHGKVAFRFAECNRCHAGPKDRIDEKGLKRN